MTNPFAPCEPIQPVPVPENEPAREERLWKYRMAGPPSHEWLFLPEMREKYLKALDRLELLKSIGSSPETRKALEADCWKIRTEAFRILVKLYDEGKDVNGAAACFGWNTVQLGNSVLRDWLCKGGDEKESELRKSEETPEVSTVHHPLGEEGLWHTPSKKVPEKQQLPLSLHTCKILLTP